MQYNYDAVVQALGAKIVSTKYLGGGSFGRVFKATLDDGRVVAIKNYSRKDLSETEAKTLRILAEHTNVKVPEVYYYNEDLLVMEFLIGQNLLHPKFIFKSKEKKKDLAKEIINGKGLPVVISLILALIKIPLL